MNMGWVKVERAMLQGPLMGSAELLQLYLYGLLKAAHQPQVVNMTVGEGILPVHLLPGQWIFGRKVVAAKLGQVPSSCYNRLNKLAALGLITLKSGTHWTVVTICSSTTYEA